MVHGLLQLPSIFLAPDIPYGCYRHAFHCFTVPTTLCGFVSKAMSLISSFIGYFHFHSILFDVIYNHLFGFDLTQITVSISAKKHSESNLIARISCCVCSVFTNNAIEMQIFFIRTLPRETTQMQFVENVFHSMHIHFHSPCVRQWKIEMIYDLLIVTEIGKHCGMQSKFMKFPFSVKSRFFLCHRVKREKKKHTPRNDQKPQRNKYKHHNLRFPIQNIIMLPQ